MSWFRKRKTIRDREAGLVFAWRVPHSSSGRMLIATVIIGLIVAAAATTVKVRVLPPARVLERTASLQMADPSMPAAILRSVDERSPFPLKLDPGAVPHARQLVAEAMERSGPKLALFQPELRNWPDAPKGNDLSAVVTGVQVLPPWPARSTSRLPVATAELVPHLTVANQDLSARVPAPLPEWTVPIDPKWAGKSLQVIAEVAADGSIRSLMPVDPAAEAWLGDATAWLRRVRFEGPVQEGYYPMVLKFAARHD